MNFEETKQRLESLTGKKRLLKSLEMQLAEARQNIGVLSAVDYTKDRIVSGDNQSTTERSALHIHSLSERYEAVMMEVFEIEDEIAKSIEVLNETEQSMIIDRYIHGWSWRKICREHNYAERQPFRIINTAIQKISINRETM